MAWSNTWPWTNLLSSDMPVGAQSQASIFATIGAWINALAGNTPVTAAGTITITPSAANTPTTGTVTFPTGRFTTAPIVLVAASTTVPGTQVTGVGVYNTTTTGCTIYLTRTNTTITAINWLAVLSP